jgi:DNA-binding response OmpR family regulator
VAKILVIEDNFDIAEMILQVLFVNSHEVEFAYKYADAFKKCIAFAPDLIIIDVWLGVGNGRELCQEIRSFNKKVPVILMSANADDLQDYHACEANDIIEKPFDIKELLIKIDSLLK